MIKNSFVQIRRRVLAMLPILVMRTGVWGYVFSQIVTHWQVLKTSFEQGYVQGKKESITDRSDEKKVKSNAPSNDE